MKGAYSIILIIACYFIVNGIYTPAMPTISEYFAVGGESIRASVTLFQLGALISCIIAGLFADNMGKKNFLMIGLSFAILGSIICMATPNLYLLFLGRFFQGIGAAAGFTMGFALAVDLYKPDVTLKIIALNGVVTSLVSVIIPYTGGTLTELWNWRATFLFMVLLFSIAAFNSIRKFPIEANIRKEYKGLSLGLIEYFRIATNRTYLCYAILNAIFIGVLIFSISYMPFFLKNSLSFQDHTIGLLVGGTIFLPFGLASISSIKLYERVGIDRSIYIALFICLMGAGLVSIAAYIFPIPQALIMLGTIVYYLGFGFLYSGSITRSMRVFLDLTTKASALRTIMISLFSLLGGFLAQHANDKNLMHFAMVLVTSALISLIFFYFRGKE